MLTTMTPTIDQYLRGLRVVLDTLHPEEMDRVIAALREIHRQKKRVFLIGNGGSAATANHFACDFGKNAIKDEESKFKIISLSDNICAITAYGNDEGYENTFVQQLKNLMEPGDMLIAISASGNSPNIIKAVQYARAKNAFVIGLTGFDGGRLKALSDINLNVGTNIIEQVEDIHLIILHIIVYTVKHNFN
ncbi:MAG: SIS domain-containing protein [Bacteroidota bacterium]